MPQRFEPLADLSDMTRAVSRLLGEPAATATRHVIAIDIAESPDALEVTAYLPGMKRENVEAELVSGVLVLRAERALPGADSHLLHVESPYGRFERRITVGRGVRSDGAAATWQDGTLTIRLPKSDAVRPQTIPIVEASGGEMAALPEAAPEA